jgi:hypothetical protein
MNVLLATHAPIHARKDSTQSSSLGTDFKQKQFAVPCSPEGVASFDL